MLKQQCLVVVAGLLLAACSEPREPPGGDQAPATGEQLLASAPEGWKQVYGTSAPGLRLAEYIPDEDSEDNWREKISFESLRGDPLPDPIDFVNGISTDQEGTCNGFESYSTFTGHENGYPTAVQFLVCSRSKLLDRSQVTMIKAIQGNDFFYVISRALRQAPLAPGAQALTEETVAAWSLYLRAISLCDPGRPEHPCK